MHTGTRIPDGYDFLGHLYDAVLAPDGFRLFVDKLVEVLDLRAVTMIIRHCDTHEVKALWLAGAITQAWAESYALEYARDDVLASHIMQAPIAHFYASNLDVSYPDGFSRTRFYTEWLAPQGVAYAAGAIVLQEGPWLTQLILQRRRDQPPFARDEMDLLNRLVPHLQRAIQMRQRLDESRIDRQLLAAGLDALAMPVFLFNERMRVAHCNRSAERLIEEGVLYLQDGHLQARNGALTRRLGFDVSLAVAASRRDGISHESVTRLPREGHPPLLLLMVPLHAGDAALPHGAALMFVFDPEQQPQPVLATVQALFGLSAVEAQLAVALCCGRTLGEFAEERGTSLHTVKSQLKNIYLKTGTRRQPDLVSMLLASPAFFVVPPVS
ncbi:LuxR family transcriptional regulator [Oxalicibacterium flavum]|uniref:LuxR family transcriptional regulator n=1 Tax=Oxalicibacterium flavum TaxID=179467 RepID=A0A8J2XVA2_9BURK|nr:hypothetical protein [Oxalicibacterium flavum]GGC11477.1 LuxR family transcriptional regulator [Oxalicibacterium flavum]